MQVVLITYDLSSPGQNYQGLLERIKSHDSWARLSESSYAVYTSKTAIDVYSGLSDVLDSNDQLYCITLTSPWTGKGSKEVNEWLQKHL